MARLNLTLDAATNERLTKHAKAVRVPRSAAARKLLAEALDQLEAREEARTLAAAYIAERKDPEARALLRDIEKGQLDLMSDAHD